MATANKPGLDSYYLVVQDNAELLQKVTTLTGLDKTVQDVLIYKDKRSAYIWLSDEPAKTGDGNLVIEVSRTMLKAQQELSKTIPAAIYDKDTIQKIMAAEVMTP